MRDGSQLSLIDAKAVLSPNQAAGRLGMSRTHLYKLLDGGEIVFHRVGRDRRIRVSDVIAFEARRQRGRRELAERFAPTLHLLSESNCEQRYNEMPG